MSGRDSVLFDVVVPICGARGCLGRYLRDILRRAYRSCRVVLVSSNSASGSKALYSRCTGVSGIAYIRRGGRNLSTTEGANITISHNRCLLFLSSSSCLLDPSTLRVLTTGTGKESLVRFF